MQDESLIKLLTETLKFYAYEKNYESGTVEKDGGYQARHVLNLVKENEESLEKYEKLFDEFTKQSEEKVTQEDIVNMIKKLKNTSESYE